MIRIQRITSSLLAAVALASPLSGPAAGQTPTPDGDVLFARNDFTQARAAYQSALKSDPRQAGTYLGLVRTLLRLDLWDDAVREAQDTTQRFADNADAHGLLSLSLFRAGRTDEAALEAKRALALDKNSYWGLIASGRGAAWDGHEAEARQAFRHAATLRPSEPDAWQRLVEMATAPGDEAEQIQAASSYLRLAPQGHPHDKTVEWLSDHLTNSRAYWQRFGPEKPYQELQNGHQPVSPEATATFTAPLERDDNNILLPVTVNGQKFHVLLDTGGGGTLLLGRKAADRLHLQSIAPTFVRGVDGREPAARYKAETMTWGSLTLQAIPFEVVQDRHRFGKQPGQIGDGIFSGGILREYVVSLDLTANTATLTRGPQAAAPPPLAGDSALTLPFHLIGDHMYLPMTVADQHVWALADTGAEETTTSLRVARALSRELPKDSWREGSAKSQRGMGASEKQMDYLLIAAHVFFAFDSPKDPLGLDVPRVAGISALDTQVSSGADFETGMLLGMTELTQFTRITIDYPHHLMTLEYPGDAPPKH